MKRVIKILGCVLLFSMVGQVTNAAQPDSSLQSRNLRQQLFVYEYIQEHEPASGFQSPEAVLEIMQTVAGAWSAHVSDQPPVYQRFNPYVPMGAVHTFFRSELPAGSVCVVWSRMAVPAFIRDVEYLEHALQNGRADLIDAAYIISLPNFQWAALQPPTYRCRLPEDLWEQFRDAVFDYPGIIQQYIDALAYPDSAAAEYLHRVHRTARNARQFIELLDLLYQNQLTGAFAGLAADIPDAGDYVYIYVETGRRLYDEFMEKGQTDMALATLDVLLWNIPEQFLLERQSPVLYERKQLRELYEQADPTEGPARFERAIALRAGSLRKSPSRATLTGEFFNATTGDSIRLGSVDTEYIVLDFWSVTCGPCIKEIPQLNALAAKYPEKVTLLSINSDLKYDRTVRELRNFVETHDIAYPVLLDTEEADLMEQFQVGGWPTRFLLDKDGYSYIDPYQRRHKLTLSEIESYLDRQD